MEQGTFNFADEQAPAPVKLCECGCGQPAPIADVTRKKTGQVKGQPLRFIRGHYKGDASHMTPPRKLFVEAGQLIGWSVVLEPEVSIPRPDNAGSIRGVRLRCGCGNEYVRPIAEVAKRKNPSCGCRLPVNRTGQKFGMLTALRLSDEEARKRGPGTWWLCRCDCGNEVDVHAAALGAGHTKSCGCLKKGPRKGYLPGEAALKLVLRDYRGNARKRSLSWELADADFLRLVSLDCFYCGAPPSMTGKSSRGKARPARSSGECVYNGLDRIDNALGYTLANVVTCCKICNHAKVDMPYDDFLAWIARLIEYHHPEVTPSLRLVRREPRAS